MTEIPYQRSRSFNRMAAKGPVKSRSRSVPAPDTNGNTKYRQNADNARTKRRVSTGPIPTRMPKYNKGYHAVLAMIKDLKDMKETGQMTEPRFDMNEKPKRRRKYRSRSYNKGKSIYFEEDGLNIPNYRSKSVDRHRREIPTFTPVTNEDDIISYTYTGRESRPMSEESVYSYLRGSTSRRKKGLVQKKVESVPPSSRLSYDFDDLQARIYQQIQKAYGQADSDVKHKQFFLSLAMMQREHNKLKHLNLSKRDRLLLEKSFDEMKSLKEETVRVLSGIEQKQVASAKASARSRRSPMEQKLRGLMNRKPKEDPMLTKEKPKEKPRLKPIRPAREKRELVDDFYTRQRLTGDWRYNVHHEQRLLNRTEASKVPIRRHPRDWDLSQITNSLTSTHGRHRPRERPVHNRSPPETDWRAPKYKDAKESLMYQPRPLYPSNILRHPSLDRNVTYRYRLPGL